jgi:hypothetical protein
MRTRRGLVVPVTPCITARAGHASGPGPASLLHFRTVDARARTRVIGCARDWTWLPPVADDRRALITGRLRATRSSLLEVDEGPPVDPFMGARGLRATMYDVHTRCKPFHEADELMFSTPFHEADELMY